MAKVKTGLEILLERKTQVLRGARVGLISHQASVDSRLRHAIDLFRRHKINLTTIFAPEHGFWGTAQDQVPIPGQKDPLLGLPIYSLYGENRSPSLGNLQAVDILICDLQDVGSRYYTFVWTMALAMQACAKTKRKMIVLDRPNPLGGKILEGPVLDSRFASFVGLYPAPVRHGLTIGELALWLNGAFHPDAELEVLPMAGWKRGMDFAATGLPWVMPSPNMPTPETARVYPGSCLIEGTNVSEGRGTTRPFELIGAPYIHPDSLAELLSGDKLPGVLFRACRFEPTFHKFQGQSCGGIQIHVTDPARFKPFLTGLAIIQRVRDLYPRDFAWRPPPYEYEKEKLPFDILCGTDRIRLAMEAGRPLASLERSWQADLEAFDRQRKPFLLYN